MKTIALIIFAIIVLFFAFLIEENITSRLEVRRVERINEQMAILRDRAKSNPPDTQALNSMISSLKSKDRWERGAAIGFLGQVGDHAEPAVDMLVEALNSTDPYDARGAADSLGGIGPGARRAIPALIKAVKQHDDADIGWFAAESLGHIANSNDTEVITVLTQATKSSDERMRFSANAGLQALGSSK